MAARQEDLEALVAELQMERDAALRALAEKEAQYDSVRKELEGLKIGNRLNSEPA